MLWKLTKFRDYISFFLILGILYFFLQTFRRYSSICLLLIYYATDKKTRQGAALIWNSNNQRPLPLQIKNPPPPPTSTALVSKFIKSERRFFDPNLDFRNWKKRKIRTSPLAASEQSNPNNFFRFCSNFTDLWRDRAGDKKRKREIEEVERIKSDKRCNKRRAGLFEEAHQFLAGASSAESCSLWLQQLLDNYDSYGFSKEEMIMMNRLIDLVKAKVISVKAARCFCWESSFFNLRYFYRFDFRNISFLIYLPLEFDLGFVSGCVLKKVILWGNVLWNYGWVRIRTCVRVPCLEVNLRTKSAFWNRA